MKKNAIASFSVLSLLVTFAITASETVASPSPSSAFPFSPGFNIQKVADTAETLPSHVWEYGTAAEALLELWDPSYSVFGDKPFPIPIVESKNVKSLAYAASKFRLGTAPNVLVHEDGTVGDPASLGVSAVLLGTRNKTFEKAAQDEIAYLLNDAPRWQNGAISHRAGYTELWADFMYMAPPFIAYFGAAYNDISVLQEAVDQATKYRQVLRTNPSGAWAHIVGPRNSDPGLWSTGNAWAAAGMTRVLATVLKAPIAYEHQDWQNDAVGTLSGYIQEILDAAVKAPTQEDLLINYWNDAANADERGYGEISGTSLLASVAYRLALIKPEGLSDAKPSGYISWADKIRAVLGGEDSQGNSHITSNGTATPAVDPLNWYATTPYTAGSPEGNNFVVLLYAAWRDCVQADICS